MNYEQARQIDPNSPPPRAGKWNWTNLNDSVAPGPFTVAPCWRADGQACDHDTREEAERHYYEYMKEHVSFDAIDPNVVEERRRCVVCGEWETYRQHTNFIHWAADSYCDEHASLEGWMTRHPFFPGMSFSHS